MAYFQAFLAITLLTWAAVSLSGTTEELSKATGDTVNIPCPFGEGTVRNIYWYYTNCTGGHKIVFFVKEEFTFGAEYANRTNLQKDNSTLILTDITVADEGTYCCTVDRQGQRAVSDINTMLNVFSLRPETLPRISPCTRAGAESSSCNIHANQSFTLTCTLPNVYPVEDTGLIWYQDGKRVSSTDDVTQNDDGTTDISRQIQVSKTGNFTCNATYLSANGRENTAVSVEAWIIPPADVPPKPGKNLESGEIAGITICIVVVGILAIIIFCISWKRRVQRSSRKDKKKREETQLNPVTSTEDLELLGTSAKNGSKDRNAESVKPIEGTAENRPTNKEVDTSNLPPPHTVTQGGNANRSDERKVSDGEIIKLSKIVPYDKYTELCVALGIDINYSKNILIKYNSSCTAACGDILKHWSTQTGGFTQDLDSALVKSDLKGLICQYKE